MMGMPGEIKFGHDIPETREGIVKRIEELEKHKPINWLGAMARHSELEAMKVALKKLDEKKRDDHDRRNQELRGTPPQADRRDGRDIRNRESSPNP